MNMFTHSVDQLYAYIQQQQPHWKETDGEYHILHDKAGKLGVVLLLHTKEQTGQDLSLLPVSSQDPESVTACKQAMQPLLEEFFRGLCKEQHKPLELMVTSVPPHLLR